MRNLARVQVSYSVLEEMLHLPAGTTIYTVERCDEGASKKIIDLIVEHPSLPPLEPLQEPPTVQVVIEVTRTWGEFYKYNSMFNFYRYV